MDRYLNNINRKYTLINGVYSIRNIINKKIYIGSSSAKDYIYTRLIHHKESLIKNKHHNIHLQRSFNKYGIDNFCYYIIEKCKPEDCIKREQYYIDNFKPAYNISQKANNTYGVIFTEERKLKISKSNKEFWNNPENRIKMLNSFKNRKKRIKKEKIKNIYHGGCKKVLNNDTGEIYNSVIEASKKLNITYTYLIAILNKKRKSTKNVSYI